MRNLTTNETRICCGGTTNDEWCESPFQIYYMHCGYQVAPGEMGCMKVTDGNIYLSSHKGTATIKPGQEYCYGSQEGDLFEIKCTSWVYCAGTFYVIRP